LSPAPPVPIAPVTIEAVPGRPLLGLIVILVLVMAGLTALDKSLAKIEDAEVRNSARRSYESGKRFLDQGLAAKAVDPLRDAHALERENAGYTLALISALRDVGKTSEADTLMDEILALKPNDGQANLVAARLVLREGKVDDAEAYYHRAIYGSWPGGSWPADSEAHKRAARLELIQLLQEKKARQPLLAELISLESEASLGSAATEDPQAQSQVAQLFLSAGAWARAAAVYRSLIERDPHDSAAYEGLGEAKLEEGQYRAAQAAFLRASNYRRNGPLQSRLQLLTQLTELDPTPRRLTSMEKYSRSLSILSLAKNDLESHLSSRPGAATPDVTQLLEAGSGELSKPSPAHATNEMAEHELDLAERLWKERLAIFGAQTTTDEEALRLCMEKLLQASPGG
jgi:tetratricopeptide (TPR) repeat protein